MQNPEGRGLTPHKTWSLDDHRPQCAKLNSLMGGGGELSVSQAGRRLLSETPEGRVERERLMGSAAFNQEPLFIKGPRRKRKETHPGTEIPPTRARARVCVCVRACARCCVQLSATPWTVARQAPLPTGGLAMPSSRGSS